MGLADPDDALVPEEDRLTAHRGSVDGHLGRRREDPEAELAPLRDESAVPRMDVGPEQLDPRRGQGALAADFRAARWDEDPTRLAGGDLGAVRVQLH